MSCGLGPCCNPDVGGGLRSAIRLRIDNARRVDDLDITSPGGVPTLTFSANVLVSGPGIPLERTLGPGNDLATLADVVGFLDEHATNFAGIFAELRPPYTGGMDAALLAEHDYVSGASIEGPATIEIAGDQPCPSDTVPSGAISIALARLRSLLSELISVQEFLDAPTTEAAIEAIHLIEVSPSPRPLVLLMLDSGFRFDRDVQGDTNFEPMGPLRVRLERAVSDGEIALGFTNRLGAVIDELAAGSISTGDLQVTGVELIGIAQRSDPKERGSASTGGQTDYWTAELRMRVSGGLD